MWKITFLYKGYVSAVMYNDHSTIEAAIDFAKMGMVNDYDTVSAVDMDNDSPLDDY